MREKAGLGIVDRRGRLTLTGDTAHRFYYLLADLFWDLTSLFNLERGWRPEKLDRDQLWENQKRTRRRIAALRELSGGAKDRP